MDVLQHDFRPPPSADPSSPSPHQIPSSGSVSNTQLAALLADAYRENDNLRKELLSVRKRAEKAERVSQIVNSDPSSAAGSATNGGGPGVATLDIQQLQQKHAESIRRLIDEYDEQLHSAHLARDEAEARKRVAQDGWDQLERYLADLELHAKDARSSFSRLSSGASTTGSLSLTAVPSPLTLLSSSVSSPSSAHPAHYASAPMGPPGAVPSRHTSRHSSSRSGNVVFPVLPPHPNPNPPTASGTSHAPSTRRPRTPSMDAYAANQPPTKRSRATADDQGGRESRTSYSEPYISAQPHDYQDPLRPRRQQPLQGHPEARIIDRNYGSYQNHTNTGYPQHARRSSHSRSGSHSSASSLDVDEMIIRAAAEEHAHSSNTNGARYFDPISQSHLAPSGRRRDGESPRPPGGPGVASSTNHYSQSAPASYPANQSAPGSLRNVQGSQGHVYTTHVFAPVVTGAPTKKSKFPNTAANTGVPGSGPSLDNAQGTTPTAPFAATNAQGQRICRQCGMVGRYKDGKCVEKWGPGPMGPGTVCDRCRKKMKRVERRGTLESQQLQNAAALQQQHFHPRTAGQPQVPFSSQGADRSIQRSDTLLASQGSLGPASFTQRSEGSHQQSNHRTSTGNPSSTSGKAGKGVSRLSTPLPFGEGISGLSTPPPFGEGISRLSTPPPIAALREPDDDDDNEDIDQLPISNVGRGGLRVVRTSTAAAHSRSSSRNRRGNGNGNVVGATKKSVLSNTSRPSVSPKGGDIDVEEMDADADADADLDAEAEILGAAGAPRAGETEAGNAEGDADADAEAELFEAVDAAEAISSSSHGNDRSWMKAEV